MGLCCGTCCSLKMYSQKLSYSPQVIHPILSVCASLSDFLLTKRKRKMTVCGFQRVGHCVFLLAVTCSWRLSFHVVRMIRSSYEDLHGEDPKPLPVSVRVSHLGRRTSRFQLHWSPVKPLITAVPVIILTTVSWQTLGQNHLAKPLEDSWPRKMCDKELL